MIRQIRKHKAVWYPGAEEMLTALKNRGYHLVILSNCKASYREAHWKEFGMERWFDRFYGEKGELNGADHLAEHIEDILQLVI